MGKSLLDDGDEDVLEEGLKVNKDFAKRFEHNERRKELHRLEAKHPEKAARFQAQALRAQRRGEQDYVEEDEESSSSEEEDDGYIAPETETDIAETLLRIRRKDPTIYKSEIHFFKAPSDDEDEGVKAEKEKKQKPLYLKDVLARQMLEHGPEIEDEEGDGGRSEVRKPAKAYDAEQEGLRKAFLEAVEEELVDAADADFGGVLAKRKEARHIDSDDGDGDDDDDDGGAADAAGPVKKPSKKEKKLWSEVFGDADPKERFLKDFILSRGWVDKDDEKPSYGDLVGDDEEVDDEFDEEHLEETDRFEAAYNFRFEEPGSANIVSHPRVIEGTIRKEDSRRKKQREEKANRLKEVEDRNREEVKQLKNLKRREIEDQMKTLQRVSGSKGLASGLDSMLEGDFDPVEWDKKMEEAFGDDFYNVDLEVDDEEKAVFDDDMVNAEIGKLVEDGGEEEEEEQKDDKPRDKVDVKAQEGELQKLLDEYYKLDYEGTAGGLRTRFRYKQVPMQMFGLDLDDVLKHSDKELNQVIGLKRLAPYREDQQRMKPNYKALAALKGTTPEMFKKKRKQHKDDFGGKPAWKPKGDWNGAASGPKLPKRGRDDNKQSDDQKGQDGGKGPKPTLAKDGSEKEAKRQRKNNKGDKRDGGEDPAAARLASYARLTLSKDEGGKDGKKGSGGGDSSRKGSGKKGKKDGEKKGKEGGEKKEIVQAAAAVSDGPKLSKAAKKNKKRAEKRAKQVAAASS